MQASAPDVLARIVRSKTFVNSDRLVELMRYLAAVPEPAKDSVVAAELGMNDGSVRRNVGRLRDKLSAYYAAEGIADPYIAYVPGGPGYILRIEPRQRLTAEMQGRIFNARTEIDQRTAAGFSQAIALLQPLAMTLSPEAPESSLVHALLARAYSLLAMHGVEPPRETLALAEQHVEKAFAANPPAWQAYAAKAALHVSRREWAEAERNFAAAREQAGPAADMDNWRLAMLIALGKFDPLITSMEQFLLHSDLRPPLALRGSLGLVQMLAKRYDDAEAQLTALAEIAPKYHLAHLQLALVACGRAWHEPDEGRRQALYAQAAERVRHAIDCPGSEPFTPRFLVFCLAQAGRNDEANQLLDRLVELRRQQYVPVYHMALAHMGLGRHDDALHALDQAIDEQEPLALWLPYWPIFFGLQQESRFREMARSICSPVAT